MSRKEMLEKILISANNLADEDLEIIGPEIVMLLDNYLKNPNHFRKYIVDRLKTLNSNTSYKDSNSEDKIEMEEKEEIEYRDLDWRGFIYTDADGFSSYFNSLNERSSREIDWYVSMLNKSVEKVGDKYIITFVPKCLKTVISRGARGLNNGFIQLEMSLDELKKFKFSDDMDINLSGEKSLIEEIKKKSDYGHDGNMAKVSLPFLTRDIAYREEDLAFAKILFNFVDKFRRIGIVNSMAVLFTNNGNNLSFSDILKVSGILGAADVCNFVIDASVPNYTKMLSVNQDLYCRRCKPICINGLKREKFEDSKILTLDINKGLCSEENIVNLYRFVKDCFKHIEKESRLYFDDNGEEFVSDGYSFRNVVILHEIALKGELSYKNGEPASKESYDLVEKMYREFEARKVRWLNKKGFLVGVDIINDAIQKLEDFSKNIYGKSLEKSGSVSLLSLIDSKEEKNGSIKK